MDTIDISSRRELFVDLHLIDRFAGASRLELHGPKREEVVLQVEGEL